MEKIFSENKNLIFENSKKKYIIYWDNVAKNGLTNDYELMDELLINFRVNSHGIGTAKYARRQNKLSIKPFVLDKYDVLFLLEKNNSEKNSDLNLDENFDKDLNNNSIRDREIFFEELKRSNKYKVYKDLKERGFYITTGLKFGADFLLYNDDPQCVHSEFLVLIKGLDEKMNLKDVISLERISVSTKKKYLLAYFNEEINEVHYKYLEWTNI